jgi:transcriptional regulator with XRE-family HTH domain
MTAQSTPFESGKKMRLPTKATRHDVKWSFATALKACRGCLGISHEELAGRAGLHRTYVSDIERGARNLSLESIDKLAKALEIPVSTFFSRLSELTQPASGTSAAPVTDELLMVTPQLGLQWALLNSGSRAFSADHPRAGPALG